MSLLIVEDNDDVRNMIREIVQDMTDAVHECSDDSQVMASFERHRPDWVLMDFRPGGSGGLESIRRLRANFPEARVVLVTDVDDPELRRAAEEAGAEHLVPRENLLSLRRIVGNA